MAKGFHDLLLILASMFWFFIRWSKTGDLLQNLMYIILEDTWRDGSVKVPTTTISILQFLIEWYKGDVALMDKGKGNQVVL